MRRQLRWYGASPLHLLALLACFGVAGYAAARLIPSQPLGVATWFLGAVIGHDLVLMPLYSLADRSAMAAIRHREPQLPVTPWINYVRVPAALSGLLLLVWFPLILRLKSPYHASTTLSEDPYVWHWLAVTGVLFLLSAVLFALRLRRGPRTALAPQRPAAVPADTRADVAGEHKTDSGPARQAGPSQADADQADADQEQPPGVLEEREPEQQAGELTPAETDCRQDPPESSSGQPGPAADDQDPPSPVLPQPADPQHDVRPCDSAPDAE